MEILISFIVSMSLIELYVWLDPFAKWLVRWAAKRLPHERDADFIAQWEGDLATVPNSIFKVYFVLRDCVLPINAIQQTMFREEFGELADDLGRLIDTVGMLDNTSKRTRTAVEDTQKSGARLITGMNQCIDRLQQLQQGDRAQKAIDHVRTLSPRMAEKISEYLAGQERYHNYLSEFAASLREPLDRAANVQSQLKHRLLDKRPIDNDDEGLLDTYLDAVVDIQAVWNAHSERGDQINLVPVEETKTAMSAAMDALRTAIHAVKEARLGHSAH